MRGAREAVERRRSQEFDAFVAGAAGRLLHIATLLTCDDAKAAERLLEDALVRAHLGWPRLRGDDPYARTRDRMITVYARRAVVRRLRREPPDGRLSGLTPQERVVLLLRLYEGVNEEQVGALLGLAPDRVSAVCARACLILRGEPRFRPSPSSAPVRSPLPAGGGR